LGLTTFNKSQSTLRLGGVVESSVHLDGLMLKPTVLVDGKTLVKEGKVLVWFILIYIPTFAKTRSLCKVCSWFSHCILP